MSSTSTSTNKRVSFDKGQSGSNELFPETDKKDKPRITPHGDIKVLTTVQLNSPGFICKFSETGEVLAVGLTNGDIQIYGGSDYVLVSKLSDEHTKADRLPVTSINFIPPRLSDRGELLVATYASGTIKFWSIDTGEVVQTIHAHFQLLTGALTPTADQLIVAGSSEDIFVYDVTSGRKINTCHPSEGRFVMDGHRFRICALKHHPGEDNVFLSGGWDDTVQIWDQREEHASRRISGPHICGEGIDFDIKQGAILTASWRRGNALQVWDYGTANLLKSIPADASCDSLLYCGQWLGKNSLLCGGSDNPILRVIDKKTSLITGIITGFSSGVYSIDHDRHRLIQHQHHAVDDASIITAVAGNHLYFLSNDVQPDQLN